MRYAAARAASRRGSSRTIVVPASQDAASRAGGTSVVLPAPGGACKTTDWLVSTEPRISGSSGSIGSGERVSALDHDFTMMRNFDGSQNFSGWSIRRPPDNVPSFDENGDAYIGFCREKIL